MATYAFGRRNARTIDVRAKVAALLFDLAVARDITWKPRDQ
jgi:hypothetical protein